MHPHTCSHLRQIEKSISRIEVELHRSMKNEELFQMMELEKSLIYFSTSLKSKRGRAGTDPAHQAAEDV